MGNFRHIGFLIQCCVIIAPKDHFTQVHRTKIIRGSHTSDACITVIIFCRCKNNRIAIQCFQRIKIVGSKNQLSLARILDNAQQFSKQILIDTRVQFINRKCDGWIIICRNQQMQDGCDFLNAFRFILQRQSMRFSIRTEKFARQLNFCTLISIFHQLSTKFYKCQFHTRNDFAENHTDSRYNLLDNLQEITRNRRWSVNWQRKHTTRRFCSEIDRNCCI